VRKRALNLFQVMVSMFAWVLQYVSHQLAAVPQSWCVAKRTFSQSVHWEITSFFSTPLNQSSASMGSLACEKVVGRVRRNSAERDWCGGGGGGACYWLDCILLRVCSISCISWFWVVSSCSRLALLLLLLLLLLGWPLHWMFLVFTISWFGKKGE
jgi:hypothetical protein